MAGWEKLKQTERDKMDQNASSQIFRSTRRNFFSIFVRKKKEEDPFVQTIKAKINQVNKRPWSLSWERESPTIRLEGTIRITGLSATKSMSFSQQLKLYSCNKCLNFLSLTRRIPLGAECFEFNGTSFVRTRTYVGIDHF